MNVRNTLFEQMTLVQTVNFHTDEPLPPIWDTELWNRHVTWKGHQTPNPINFISNGSTINF